MTAPHAATPGPGAGPDLGARAVLALGANLGDRAATLRSAVRDLAATPGVRVVAVSGVIETAPVGGPRQPDFLNAVVLADVDLPPKALLAACLAIEARHGRGRAVRWGPRTLDIDLVDIAGMRCHGRDLTLPHPRASARAFVLAPWAGLDPQALLPGPIGPRRVVDLLARALDRRAVRRRPDLRLPGPGVLPAGARR